MDHAACHVVYVDSRVSQDLDGKHIENENRIREESSGSHSVQFWEERNPQCLKAILGEIEEVRTTLKRLLLHFNGVHTCNSGRTCMANLRRLDTTGSDHTPMLVLSGITIGPQNEVRMSHASDRSSINSPSPDSEGLYLLHHLSNEIIRSNLSRLVIPIAVIYSSPPITNTGPSPGISRLQLSSWGSSNIASTTEESWPEDGGDIHSRLALKSIDAGAVDVFRYPLGEECMHSLTIRAYRTHKDSVKERTETLAKKRSRKLSWLGNTENKPYAYLREKMVSELMTGICNPEEHLHLGDQRAPSALDPAREVCLQRQLGSWDYSGHDYSEEELVHAAGFMLQHALALPELEKWRLSLPKLMTFLMASRAAYNEFVDYHNFRHVIDVMQAIFYFLIQLGILPAYPAPQLSSTAETRQSPIATLLKPLDALTLLITAIGHDVGHPGVNNAFLVALNAPLAQLYNDKSVLEAFHCAAYSQILRRYWSSAFEDTEMRSLMINSILATDMGMHQKYMIDLGNLQEKLHHQQGIDGFNAQQLEEYRILTCALLVKCADISNVARPFDVAIKWANILQLEFANQGTMERDVGIPTTLFGGPPEIGNLIKLGQSQNSFMNFFARPLFEAVTDILPDMGFAVDELKINQTTWTKKIKAESEKGLCGEAARDLSTGALSPRSRSPHRSESQPELSHPEGLPASSPSSELLLNMAQSQPSLPSQAGRLSEPAVPAYSHALSDLSLPSKNASRRSSQNTHLQQQGFTTDPTADFSRRSSGALSNASNPNVAISPRRTSNSSPSQLQLGPELRSHTNSSTINSENRFSKGRASEDTLSQMQFVNGSAPAFEPRRGSANSGRAADISRPGSKGNEQFRSNPSITYQSTTQSHVQCVHHRTSSGAHTNNTNASQSTPYSPTGTQATSVLTVDSDEKNSQSRMDSWPERNGAPNIPDVDEPGHMVPFGSVGGIGSGARELDVKRPVLSNGSVRSTVSSHRSLGKKSSRFNIFHWKRKGSRIEASP